ncbi:hypothetical protein GCM10009720_00110 [Yaniella flava]|uniref:Polysaccharide biosynthesis protein n=1 Tax=Yaniella flava TaxID=287930 RepID=A0ABN2TX96_9MICC
MAIAGAYLIYYDFAVTPLQGLLLMLLVVVSGIAQLLFGWGVFLYRRRFTAGSFDEVRAIFKVTAATGLTLFFTGVITGYFSDQPAAIAVIVIPIAMVLMFGIRYGERLRMLARAVPDSAAAPTLVIGAGAAGTHLIRQMVTTPGTKFWPVGMVDDALAKANVQVYHVKVMGTIADLPQLINETGANVLVVAVAHPSKEMLRTVQQTADAFDMQLKIIPPLDELLEKGLRSADLRDEALNVGFKLILPRDSGNSQCVSSLGSPCWSGRARYSD